MVSSEPPKSAALVSTFWDLNFCKDGFDKEEERAIAMIDLCQNQQCSGLVAKESDWIEKRDNVPIQQLAGCTRAGLG